MSVEAAVLADYQKPILTPLELPILSVTALSLTLKQLVETQFKRVKVRGEISGFKRHTSGHCYFTLKDQDSTIDAVCWRGTNLKTQLEDGLEVIVAGRLTTYPSRSKYQIVVEGAEAAGEGALLKLLLERKNRLREEGLFDRKRPLPSFPKRIGIVTSLTGAVLQDILHRLQDRYPCFVVVWPVLVQGTGAADQITAAIEGFNKLSPLQKPDLLIVARGGGSLEDLWCFNEEKVVRAAASSLIPLISAVGHETDTTLIDWAADLRAPTPTAAAELATPVLSQVHYTVQQYSQRLYTYLHNRLHHQTLHLKALGRALPSPHYLLEQRILRFDDWTDRLYQIKSALLTYKKQALKATAARLRFPSWWLTAEQQRLNALFSRLLKAQSRLLGDYDEKLNWLSLSLEQNSYHRILEKGFCLVTDHDKVVRSVHHFDHSTGQVILRFSDGTVKVEKVAA